MNSGNPPSGPPKSFVEVAVFFTKEEWALLDPAQRVLYWEVTHENYETAVSLGLWVPELFVDSQHHPTGKWFLQSDEESDKCAVAPLSGLWVPEPFVGSQHHATGKWFLQSDEESDRCAVVPLSGAPNDLLPDSESARIDEAMLLAQPVGEEYQPAGTSQAEAHGDSSNERTSSGQTRSVPAVETSPERRVLLEKRRQRRVGVLSSLGHQLLEQGAVDAEEARQERRERRWATSRHFELMLGIREALDRGFAAVEALTSILASKLTSQDPVHQPLPEDQRPAPSCKLQGGDAWPTLAKDTPQLPTPSRNFSDPLSPDPETQPTVLQDASLLRSQLAAHNSNPDLPGVHSSSTIPGAGEGALRPFGTQSTPQAEQQEGLGQSSPRQGQHNQECSDKTVSGKRAKKVKCVLDM